MMSSQDTHGSLLNRVYELQCIREKELETMDLTEQMSSLSFSVSVPTVSASVRRRWSWRISSVRQEREVTLFIFTRSNSSCNYNCNNSNSYNCNNSNSYNCRNSNNYNSSCNINISNNNYSYNLNIIQVLCRISSVIISHYNRS